MDREHEAGKQGIKLLYADGLLEAMGRSGIQEAYVRQLLAHAESTSEKLLDPATGRYIAHLKIGRITCWAVYAPEGDAYRVHNAYMHRMEIVDG